MHLNTNAHVFSFLLKVLYSYYAFPGYGRIPAAR